MREVCFRHSVREGTILTIESLLQRRGNTSVTYTVQVLDTRSPVGEPLFITDVTLVNVDDRGSKRTID
jgi:acyl-CoA hydrolase